MGVFQHGKVEIIANDQGNRTTPSYVGFNDSERLIGDAAKNQVAMNPTNTIFDAKRLIGRKFEDEHIQRDMKHWSFSVVNFNGKPKLQVDFKGMWNLVRIVESWAQRSKMMSNMLRKLLSILLGQAGLEQLAFTKLCSAKQIAN